MSLYNLKVCLWIISSGSNFVQNQVTKQVKNKPENAQESQQYTFILLFTCNFEMKTFKVTVLL